MASWEDAKRVYEARNNDLISKTGNTQIERLVNQMNAAISRYSAAAGITPNGGTTNADYATANAKFQELVGYQEQYSTLITDMSTKLKELTSSADVQSKLRQIGTLRDEIVNLERELENVKQDVETSKARQTDVETPRQDISYYQGFSGLIGFTRPIKLFSIPILISFGLLLLFISGLILRDFFLPAFDGYNSGYGGSDGSIFAFFTDSRFYAVMGGTALVITVVAILAYSGKLGSKLK